MRLLPSMLCVALWAAPALAEPCRALLNFAAGDATQEAYQTVEIGTSGLARTWPGLAIGADAQLTQLRLTPSVRSKPGYVQRVDRLMSLSGASWSGALPSMEGTPESGMSWDETTVRDVTAVLGPYISVSSHTGGYLGGAHGVDDPGAEVWRDGKQVDLKALLGPAAIKAGQAALKQEGKRRGGWDNAPDIAGFDLKATALRVKAGQLLIEKSVFCCTWAENHNQVEITAPVPTPKALTSYVPDAQGWFTQAGCGRAVRVHGGRVEVRIGKKVAAAGAAPGRLLGVAWVSEKAPALRRWPTDAKAAAALLKQSRATSTNEGKLGLLEAARQANPGDPDVLAEMGWLAFKLGDHRRALAYTRLALEGVIEADADGRIRYNLGRILESQGEWARARRAYKASLARRINATVQKRLKALEKKGTP